MLDTLSTLGVITGAAKAITTTWIVASGVSTIYELERYIKKTKKEDN